MNQQPIRRRVYGGKFEFEISIPNPQIPQKSSKDKKKTPKLRKYPEFRTCEAVKE